MLEHQQAFATVTMPQRPMTMPRQTTTHHPLAALPKHPAVRKQARALRLTTSSMAVAKFWANSLTLSIGMDWPVLTPARWGRPLQGNTGSAVVQGREQVVRVWACDQQCLELIDLEARFNIAHC